jgi:hypothetical protein
MKPVLRALGRALLAAGIASLIVSGIVYASGGASSGGGSTTANRLANPTIVGADSAVNTAAPTGGVVRAGNNLSGGTADLSGGTLTLSAGTSKGASASVLELKASPDGSAGTALNTPVVVAKVCNAGNGDLSANTNVMFNVAGITRLRSTLDVGSNATFNGAVTVASASGVTVNSGGSLIFGAANSHLVNAPTQTGVTAFAGGGQASAIEVCHTSEHVVVGTVASANDSVKFDDILTSTALWCHIKNKGANTLALFPASGGTICVSGSACAAANAAVTIATNVQLDCWKETSLIWNCK